MGRLVGEHLGGRAERRPLGPEVHLVGDGHRVRELHLGELAVHAHPERAIVGGPPLGAHASRLARGPPARVPRLVVVKLRQRGGDLAREVAQLGEDGAHRGEPLALLLVARPGAGRLRQWGTPQW